MFREQPRVGTIGVANAPSLVFERCGLFSSKMIRLKIAGMPSPTYGHAVLRPKFTDVAQRRVICLAQLSLLVVRPR